MTLRSQRKARVAARVDKLDIHAVAKAAKVSVATVSRAINRMPTVNPKLSQRVWDAVDKLGYVPNTQARALVSGQSRLFGVIISDITNPFFPELIQGFEDKAVELGYETLIGSTNYDLRKMQLCIDRMLQRNVEGVAVMTFGIEEPLLSRLATQGIPMVFIDLAPKGERVAAIPVDYKTGQFEAVQHLAVLGHRRIAFISGPSDLHSASARLNAFEEATKAIGLKIPSDYIYPGAHTMEVGQEAARNLLSLPTPPTAIVCSNDVTAIGAMHAISESGLSIPQDISLIGFDDVRFSQFTVPPLTTVRMSGSDIAREAVSTLRNLVIGAQEKPETIHTSLVVRRSTGIPSGTLADLRRRR